MMKARLLTLLDGWRDDWEATSTAARIVLTIVAALFLVWAPFVVWFWIAYRF